MRVLYATMQFARGYAQGTERYLSVLTAGLRERGHEIIVVAGDPEQRGPRLRFGETLPGEPEVRFFPSPGWLLVHGASLNTWRGLLVRERPDLVHLANPGHLGVSIIYAARRLDIPVVATVQDFWWLCPKHSLGHYTGRVCDAQVTWRECVRCIAADDARAHVRALGATPVLRSTALPLLYFGKALQRGATLRDIVRWTDRRRHLREALNACAAVIFGSQAACERIAPLLTAARPYRIPYGLESRWFEYAGRRRGSRPTGGFATSTSASHGNSFPAPEACCLAAFRAARGSERTEAVRPGGEHVAANAKGLVLGFAGGFARHKGLHVLLEALALLHTADQRPAVPATPMHVRIAGDGPDPTHRTRLARLARELSEKSGGSVSIDLVGRVPGEQMPAFLDSLDLLVFPSISPENVPLLILEAHAIGVPVLAADIPGVAEVVPEPRLRFEPGSATDLASRLRGFVTHPPTSPVPRPSTANEMVERTLAVYRRARGAKGE